MSKRKTSKLSARAADRLVGIIVATWRDVNDPANVVVEAAPDDGRVDAARSVIADILAKLSEGDRAEYADRAATLCGFDDRHECEAWAGTPSAVARRHALAEVRIREAARTMAERRYLAMGTTTASMARAVEIREQATRDAARARAERAAADRLASATTMAAERVDAARSGRKVRTRAQLSSADAAARTASAAMAATGGLVRV